MCSTLLSTREVYFNNLIYVPKEQKSVSYRNKKVSVIGTKSYVLYFLLQNVTNPTNRHRWSRMIWFKQSEHFTDQRLSVCRNNRINKSSMSSAIEAVYLSLVPDAVTIGSDQFFTEWTHHGVKASILPGVRIHTLQEADPFLTSYGRRCFSTGRDTHQHISSLGEIGCFLAHRKAWQHAVDHDVRLIVCEDGVVNYHRGEIVRLLPLLSGLEFVSLHQIRVQSNHIKPTVDLLPIDVSPGLSIRPIRFTQWGAKCYYLSPAFARHLLAQSITVDLQVDAFMFLEASYLQVGHTSCKYGYTSHSLLTGKSVGRCRHKLPNGYVTVGCTIIGGIVTVLVLSIFLYRCRTRSCTVPKMVNDLQRNPRR